MVRAQSLESKEPVGAQEDYGKKSKGGQLSFSKEQWRTKVLQIRFCSKEEVLTKLFTKSKSCQTSECTALSNTAQRVNK